jgi:hypothetical protein
VSEGFSGGNLKRSLKDGIGMGSHPQNMRTEGCNRYVGTSVRPQNPLGGKGKPSR